MSQWTDHQNSHHLTFETQFTPSIPRLRPAGRKRQGIKSNRTRQKNKRGDNKVESNDSPEIPDRGETDIPGLPSECIQRQIMQRLQSTAHQNNRDVPISRSSIMPNRLSVPGIDKRRSHLKNPHHSGHSLCSDSDNLNTAPDNCKSKLF